MLTAARSIAEPSARITALQSFLKNDPASSLRPRAQQLLLQTYLSSAPEKQEEIHDLASSLLLQQPTGFERWVEEARLADLLAGAGESGADLPDAQAWAAAAVSSLTPATYRREMLRAQARYQLPALTPAQLHADYVRYHASFLASLAHVEQKTGQLTQATRDVGEAFALDPLSPRINLLRGELALASHNDREALDALKRAEVLGALDDHWNDRLVQLYAALEHGSSSQLEAELDRRYSQMFPPLFTLPAHAIAPAGHTVLLELFTGSGCLPCVAPDLAIESLLSTYRRRDLVALEYDFPVPLPDPLANADGLARAADYNVQNTPEAFLDGMPLQVLGSRRSDVENVVVGFAAQLEDRAADASPVQLTLQASAPARSSVAVQLALSVHAMSPADNATAGSSRPAPSFRVLSQAMLHIALVQDGIRYTGENGVRFHRMVVRALRQSPAAAFLGNAAQPYTTAFDLHALQNTLEREAANNRGTSSISAGPAPRRFPKIDLQSGELAVVAWLQNPTTHEVYQAAYVALP